MPISKKTTNKTSVKTTVEKIKKTKSATKLVKKESVKKSQASLGKTAAQKGRSSVKKTVSSSERKSKTTRAQKDMKAQKNTEKATTKKKPTTSKVSSKKTIVEAPKKVKTASKSKKLVAATTRTTAEKKSAKSVNMEFGNNTTVSTDFMGIPAYKVSKDEEYMNAAQLEHFKQMLLVWKRNLMEEVDRTMNHMKDEASNLADPNDRASLEEEFSLELRARDRERKLIKKIDESFQLIQSNDYGYCEACGVEIGIRRLEARPTATQCIDCKTLDEMKEKYSTS